MELILLKEEGNRDYLPALYLGTVRITIIYNPWKFKDREDFKVPIELGKPVSEYISDRKLLVTNDIDLVYSLSGRILNSYESIHICPRPGDQIIVMARPHGGGGGGVMNIVAMLAVIVIAIYAPYALTAMGVPGLFAAGGGLSMWGAMITAGVMFAGTLLVNTLFPITPPSMPTLGLTAGVETGLAGDMDQSTTYSWSTMSNLQNQGFPIPRLYGTRKVTGNIINRYIETIGENQYYNALTSLGEGCFSRIENVKLSDQPIENYEDTWQNIRLGKVSQPVMDYFRETFSRQSYEAEITDSVYITKQTIGNSAEGLRVEVTCPNGLYYSASDGSANETNVEFILEYREVGGPAWLNYSSGEGGWTSYEDAVFTSNGILFNDQCEYVTFMFGASPSQVPSGHWIEYRTGDYDADDLEGGWRLWGTYSGVQEVTITGLNKQKTQIRITREPLWEVEHWFSNMLRYVNTGGLGGYVNVVGASTSSVRRSFDIKPLSIGQYEVRVKIYAKGGATTRHINKIYLTGVSEIINDDFTYPTMALLGIRVLATSQISGGAPTISCEASRDYVPVYDGSTWVAKSATNPAWASYDMLVRPVYDMDPDGSNITVYHIIGEDYTNIIYADFLAWANWCDTHSFEVNIYFDSQNNIWNSLSHVGMIGRGSVVMKGTKFSCIYDKQETLVQQVFSDANVYSDSLSVKYLPLEDRANCIEVTYYDEERDWQRESFLIYGNDYDTAPKIKKTQLELTGCTDYAQAWKEADFLLKCNKYLIRSITFDVDVDALACQVGDPIQFQSSVPQWGYSGRVVSSTNDTVVLDREVTLNGVDVYKVIIRSSDDDTLQERTITNSGVTTDILTVSVVWDSNPEKYDIFLFGVDGSESKIFRVMSITRSGDLKRTINGIEYNDTVYIEGTPVYLTESALVAYPVATNLRANERLRFNEGGAYVSEIHLFWDQTSDSAEGYWRIHRKDMTVTGSFWEYIGITDDIFFVSKTNWEKNHEYKIVVVGTSTLTGGSGSLQNALGVNITILWKQAKPETITDFSAYQKGDRVFFNWSHITDVDRDGYKIKEGPTWGSGVTVINLVQQNSYDFKPVSDGTKNYMIKAVDDSGNESETADSVAITVRNILDNLNVVVTRDEITLVPIPCPGTKDNLMLVDAVAPYLGVPHAFLDDDEIITGWDDTTADPDITSYDGSVDLDGSYITEVVDCAISSYITIRLDVEWESLNISTTDLTYPNRVDTTYPNDTDVSVTSDLILDYYYRYSTGADPTGEDWIPYHSSVEVEARSFQIKFAFELDNATSYLKFTKLAMVVDVPDVDYVARNQAITGPGTTFTLLSDFGLVMHDYYVVGITVVGAAGLFPVMDNYSLASFDVILRDKDGATQSGVVDLRIKGF
uniref:Putative tail protein n=1 Tax=viral metagenome TaxID=1070528 RepID=A0A6M3IKN5_9ZZZZ